MTKKWAGAHGLPLSEKERPRRKHIDARWADALRVRKVFRRCVKEWRVTWHAPTLTAMLSLRRKGALASADRRGAWRTDRHGWCSKHS